MPKTILTSALKTKFPLRCLILLAIGASAPLTVGISRAQQSDASQFPIPDASSMSPRLGPNSRDDDPSAHLAQQKRIKELNILRQKQLTSDAAKLLALATELQANVDKSGQESATLDLMHKAEQIEKLAHSVRTKMTDGASN
jgi:hypothetical protein